MNAPADRGKPALVNQSVVLRCGGRPVARYTYRSRASRPYLHPVTTLRGIPVTEERPADHVHHLGVCLAVPDVQGRNFWGGRTFVRGQGPTALDNHGDQVHTGFKLSDPDGLVEELGWVAEGVELLREHRTVSATELTDQAWALDFTFALTNVTGQPLSIGSPATNGRPGAGYGGFFWRAPKEATPPTVLTAGTDGEEAVHGRPADWLLLTGGTGHAGSTGSTSATGDGWSLVFAGMTEDTRRDPWFVRTTEYPGVGSSLAWDERLPVPAGGSVVRRIVTVVADGRLDRDQAAALIRKASA